MRSRTSIPRIQPSTAAIDELLRFGRATPIPGGFDVGALPGLTTIDYSPELSSHYESLVFDAASQLSNKGLVRVCLGSVADLEPSQMASVSFAILGGVGVPIKVFRNRPHWRHLTADPGRPAGKSEGIGAQGLHQDFVNATHPPRVLVLQCIRPDPLGGGLTRLCGVAGALDQLAPTEVRFLRKTVFEDGVVIDLDHVGQDANPFAVANPGTPFALRFTENLLAQQPAIEALQRLAEVLAEREFQCRLDAGDVLFIDQTRFLHGRTSLGDGQETLAPGERRLLLQSYLARIAPVGVETYNPAALAA